MVNICAIFFSVKTAPIQKPKISMQFEFWMKEIIVLYLHYFNIKTLRTLFSPCHKYSGLERFEFLVHESPCSSQKVQENVVHHVISGSSWPYEVHLFASWCNLSWTKWNRLCKNKYWNKFRYSRIQCFFISQIV